MFFSSKRHRSPTVDIWPGFVDALSTLLMVIIFVLMTFVVAQYYLSDALSSRDQTLALLTKQIDSLTLSLTDEKNAKTLAETKISDLKMAIQKLENEIGTLKADLVSTKDAYAAEETKSKSLIAQIETLKGQIQKLMEALDLELAKTKDQEAKITTLTRKLDNTVIEKTSEIKTLTDQLSALDGEKKNLLQLIEELNKKLEGGIGQFRSDFFARLKKVVGDRQDIRVVGDRFVFQSEVLFDRASAELGSEGKKQLDGLVKALKEIAPSIPKNIQWILRVDGHTDRLPINTTQFPSNWELSSARAISVVKYLISQGIDANRLVAAGFGEHQPLSDDKDEKSQARNRRIEFKLDQR
jgi:chemotaxis protein MotB